MTASANEDLKATARRIASLVPTSEAGETLEALVAALDRAESERAEVRAIIKEHAHVMLPDSEEGLHAYWVSRSGKDEQVVYAPTAAQAKASAYGRVGARAAQARRARLLDTLKGAK